MSTQRVNRDMKQMALELGWETAAVESTRGGHQRLLVTWRGHSAKITFGTSPSDRRWELNARSTMRRLLQRLKESEGAP